MPQLASTSRVQLAYIKETVFGQTPTTGNGVALRFTGESLTFTLSKESSNEINAFRSVSSMVPTKAETAGSVNAELTYAEYDPLLAAALQDNFVAYGTNGAGTSADLTFTATTITAAAAPTGTSAFTNLVAGQYFMVKGTGTNANKIFRVSKTVAPSATVITLDPATPGTIGNVTGGAVSAARLSNGVTQPSFTIERQIPEVGEYFNYKGMTVSSFKLNIAQGAITTCEFAFMGTEAKNTQVTALPGSLQASKAYDIMSGVSGTACSVMVGGTALTGTYVTSLALNYDNALRSQGAICNLSAVGIGSGTIQCTVDVELYFASGAKFFSDFVANNEIEFAFTAFDTAGNGYVFTLPAANVATYEVTAGGKDQDLAVKVQLNGMYDAANATASLRKVLFIDRLGAAVA